MAEDRYAQLKNPRVLWPSAFPRIQRVTHYLRDREAFARYYSPKLVSLGPIHHGEPHLQLGEEYKLMWASTYVEADPNKAQRLHREIFVNIKDLKDLYTKDALRHFNDDELAWMLFVDGCALLQILKHPDISRPELLQVKIDQLALVRQDALLLENQLPFRVLQLLRSDQADDKLIEDMDRFLLCHHFSPEQKPHKNGAEGGDDHDQRAIDVDSPSPNPANPAHLLDELRIKVVRAFSCPPEPKTIPTGQIRYRNLKELKGAGIEVKRSKSICPIDITFSSHCFSGELKLPDIIVDDTTAPTYLNLMAYEVCPDFGNNHEISSYVEFLSSMIKYPHDVKELISSGCMSNALGSDDDVAKLFNSMAVGVVPNWAIYASVRAEIESYFASRYRAWLAQAYHAYFSNSGSFIAFLAACLALSLTFLQTWFTIHPSK